MIELIRRGTEMQELKKALVSEEAELIAITGRIGIGKTYLIKNIYKKELVFELTGIKDDLSKESIEHFTSAIPTLTKQDYSLTHQSWMDAFDLLTKYLKTLPNKEKQVVFFDELPWLFASESSFLEAFSFFWNSWAVNQSVVIVICSSVAAWPKKAFVNHKDGIFNQITRHIDVKPLTLLGTMYFLNNRSIFLNNRDVLLLYMVIGGIPSYLKEVEADKNVIQNINQICFAKADFHQAEFSNLINTLFDDSNQHLKVIRELEAKEHGLKAHEISRVLDAMDRNRLEIVIEELVDSGLVKSLDHFSKKETDKIYRLTDEYCLFYLKCLDTKNGIKYNDWNHFSKTESFKKWSQYAFENICINQMSLIRNELSIGTEGFEDSSLYQNESSNENGENIDLVLVKGGYIYLLEIICFNSPYHSTELYTNSLIRKKQAFQTATQTKKTICLARISVDETPKHSWMHFENQLDLDNLVTD